MLVHPGAWPSCDENMLIAQDSPTCVMAHLRRAAPYSRSLLPFEHQSVAFRVHRLGPSTPGDQNDPGTSSGDGGGAGSGPAKPFLRRRSQRISMARK